MEAMGQLSAPSVLSPGQGSLVSVWLGTCREHSQFRRSGSKEKNNSTGTRTLKIDSERYCVG
jgi:hypothetical protein